MVSVEFWYKSFWGKLKGVSCSFPENWNEADERFILLYAKYLMDGTDDGVWKLIVEYAGLTDKIITANGSRGLLELKLLPLLDGVFQKVISEKTFIPQIWVKPLNQNDKQLIELHSPGKEFFQMRVGQYMIGNACIQEYAETKDIKCLDQLVACLYLPEFEVFTENTLAYREKLVQNIAPEIKKAVFLNFIAMLEWLSEHERYGVMFKKSTDESGSGSSGDLSDVVYELAGVKMGTINDVEQLGLLYFLERVITPKKTETAAA